MNISRSQVSALAFASMGAMALLISSCSQSAPKAATPPWDEVDQIEIFYRSFSQLAPLKFSERDIQQSASIKLLLDGSRDLAGVLDAIALSCEPVPDVLESDMDLHLLIRAHSRNGSLREWKASPFHFYDSAVGKVCALKSDDREMVAAEIEAIANR